MTSPHSILVVTSCTSRKASTGGAPMPAEDLYVGQQHARLMRGVRTYRCAGEPHGPLALHVLSAGHGLVAGHERLTSYDESFSGLSRQAIDDRAEALGVPRAMSTLLQRPWRLVLLLLGDRYLHAAGVSRLHSLGGPAIVLASRKAGSRMPSLAGLTTVPLYNPEARRFSCGLTALKGELGARILERLAVDPWAEVPEAPSAVLAWLDEPAPQRPHQLSLAA